MPRRLLAIAVATLALLVSAGCADDVAPAARVDDAKISNKGFLDEVAEWTSNPVAVDPSMLRGSPPGTYPRDLVSQLLQQRIDFELHNEEFRKLGLKVDDALRQQALTVLFGDPSAAEEAFSAFSDGFAKAFTDDVARQIAVQNELGDDGYTAWRTQVYAEADIDVNPRYGSWNRETGQIEPPPGPVQPAGEVTTP